MELVDDTTQLPVRAEGEQVTVVEPVADRSDDEEDREEEAGDEEAGHEVDLADEEDLEDEGAVSMDGDENANPNDSGPATEPVRVKSRAATCPLDIPFSVVRRIMKSAAPTKRFTPELITAFSRSAGTFGLYLLSACQEAAQESGRNTIRPVEVVSGLIACGFPELAEEARVLLGITTTGKRGKKGKKRN